MAFVDDTIDKLITMCDEGHNIIGIIEEGKFEENTSLENKLKYKNIFVV